MRHIDYVFIGSNRVEARNLIIWKFVRIHRAVPSQNAQSPLKAPCDFAHRKTGRSQVGHCSIPRAMRIVLIGQPKQYQVSGMARWEPGYFRS